MEAQIVLPFTFEENIYILYKLINFSKSIETHHIWIKGPRLTHLFEWCEMREYDWVATQILADFIDVLYNSGF